MPKTSHHRPLIPQLLNFLGFCGYLEVPYNTNPQSQFYISTAPNLVREDDNLYSACKHSNLFLTKLCFILAVSLFQMSSSGFFTICILHALITPSCSISIMFFLKDISVFGHGTETARKLMGSNPHDQLLIQISDSFVGLLLSVIGIILFTVAFVKDREFQGFFAKGCVVLHVLMGVWRVCFERRIEDLAWHWPRQLVGNFLLALSWVFFLVYLWME